MYTLLFKLKRILRVYCSFPLPDYMCVCSQMKKIGLGRNGVLLKPRSVTLLTWRNTPNPGLEEESETSSSSQTSDDDDT